MHTFSEKTEQFLNEGTDHASRSLAVAVIDSVGGECAFVNGRRSETIDGVKFFEDNQSEIKILLNKMTADLGVDDAAVLVLSTGHLRETCTKKEVSDVLDGQKTTHYDEISNAVTLLVVADVEMSYISFSESDDESTYFVDGEEMDEIDDRY